MIDKSLLQKQGTRLGHAELDKEAILNGEKFSVMLKKKSLTLSASILTFPLSPRN